MKKAIQFLAGILLATNLLAQAPQSFQYQAVMRDSVGNILAEKNVSIRISILQGDLSNPVTVYSEEHEVIANEFGLVSFYIGKGDVEENSFAAINWANGPFFVQTELKEDENYTLMGTSQLLSVPYALYANKAMNVDDADPDPTNEIQELVQDSDTSFYLDTDPGNLISLTFEGDGVEDDDADSTNELITKIELTANKLAITEGQNTWEEDLSSLINDADYNVENEIIKSIKIKEVNNSYTLEIEEMKGESHHYITKNIDELHNDNIDINDPDHDPENELQVLKLNGNWLEIWTKDGVLVDSVDLSLYARDTQQLGVELPYADSVKITLDSSNSVVFGINDADSLLGNELQNLSQVLARDSSAGNKRIMNVGAPVDSSDAVNKQYVDQYHGQLKDAHRFAMLQDLIQGDVNYFVDTLDGRIEGIMIDKRGYRMYGIVKIGDTWWMKHDLEYGGTVKDWGAQVTDRYGHFYTGGESVTDCPAGWKMPEKGDIDTLLSQYSDAELIKGGGLWP